MARGLSLVMLLAALFAASTVRAENVGIDVAVDVADMDPQVKGIGLTCMVCTVDCEAAAGAQVLGTGTTSLVLPATHAYSGTLKVSVPTASAKGTDYLCRMNLANGSATFAAGAGPDWTLPAEDQPFTGMLKGKLPLSKTPVAVKCANGGEPINGKCPSAGNVASTPVPVKLCPDGRQMPANGNCGFVGPLPNIQLVQPCPDGRPRQADGQCPQAPIQFPSAASKLTVIPCPSGQTRKADGTCSAPRIILRKFLLPPSPNTLH